MKRLALITTAGLLGLSLVGAEGTSPGVGQGSVDSDLLVGTWNQVSYVRAEDQVRYQTLGYMSFSATHWMHISYFNRDERAQDFAEAHHGTYEITGPDTLNMNVDIEMHMDPKEEFQDSQVFYGSEASLTGAKYRHEGNRVVIDLPSSAQIVLEKIE